MHDLVDRFFAIFLCDTPERVVRVHRLRVNVCFVDNRRGFSHGTFLDRWELPRTGPIASAQPEVRPVVVRRPLDVVQRLLGFERLTRATQRGFGFLISVEIVESGATVLLVADQ